MPKALDEFDMKKIIDQANACHAKTLAQKMPYLILLNIDGEIEFKLEYELPLEQPQSAPEV